MSKVRVLIVDDIAQVRQGLRTVLTLAEEIEVIGEAVDGRDAIQQVEELQPDVVLMDLEMPVMDGYAATTQVKSRCPSCRIIALSVHSYPEARQRAAQAGVDAFIEKGAPVNKILQAIIKKSTSQDE
jgi:DNA-binding NarL/FixJ family response regulator